MAQGVRVERATVRMTLTLLGRVCSALPGSTVDGIGAHRARPYAPAVGDGAATGLVSLLSWSTCPLFAYGRGGDSSAFGGFAQQGCGGYAPSVSMR